MTIGERIKILRKNKNLTQQELATMCGYKSLTTINKIELGINNIPLSVIEKLAFALDVSPSYLMGWEDETRESSEKTTLSEEEKKFISLVSQLTSDEVKEFSNYLEYMISKRK